MLIVLTQSPIKNKDENRNFVTHGDKQKQELHHTCDAVHSAVEQISDVTKHLKHGNINLEREKPRFSF